MVGGIDLNDRAQHGPFLQTTSAHPSTTPFGKYPNGPLNLVVEVRHSFCQRPQYHMRTSLLCLFFDSQDNKIPGHETFTERTLLCRAGFGNDT